MKKIVIYIPGLNDDAFINRCLIKLLPVIWRHYGYDIHIIYPHWNKGNSFAPKLKEITDTIDRFSMRGYRIYLIGQSAGGSAVLNAFSKKTMQVEKVVNICGRLKKGIKVFPSLDLAAKGNPAFKDSVLVFENENEKKLTKIARKKVLTIRPLFDEIVPQSTVFLNGATNSSIPMIEHSLGGIAALTIFSRKIRNFIEQ